MWLLTNIGFFSVVQKENSDYLTIRARVRNDLDNLRRNYLPDLSHSTSIAGCDYPWRATVAHDKFALALGKMVMNLHYPNFKNEVADRQGSYRAHHYHKVWSDLYHLPDMDPEADVNLNLPWPNPDSSGKKVAYGGVIFSPKGKVLLREPRSHFDGYVWTFAKGGAEPGETPEETALRETLEETGVRADIVAPIPGEFSGGTKIDRYFLMSAEETAEGATPDLPETQSIRWVDSGEAFDLLSLTKKPAGKKRDIAVLEAALRVHKLLD